MRGFECSREVLADNREARLERLRGTEVDRTSLRTLLETEGLRHPRFVVCGGRSIRCDARIKRRGWF